MARLSESMRRLIEDGHQVQTIFEELNRQGEKAGEEAERNAQTVFELLARFAGQVERISNAGRGLNAAGDGRLGPPDSAAAGLRSPGDRLLGPNETREIGREIAKEINEATTGGGGGGGGGGSGGTGAWLRLRGGL